MTSSPGSDLTTRDGRLIENWYVACLSHELGPKPIARTIYDERLALFRDGSGRAAALKDQCLHRGTFLSEGEVRDGCLACPYHGWRYDSEGAVVHVPSEGPTTRPRQKLKQSHRAVVEQDGCVWVWMGTTAPSSGPPYRFPAPKGWTSYFMITDFDNEVTNLVENFMDVPHTVFVHKGWFRSQAHTRVPIRVDTDSGRVLVTYDQSRDTIGFTNLLINPRREPMRHTDCFVLPNLTQVEYHFGTREKTSTGFIIVSQCTPVTSGRSRVYTAILYKLPIVGRLLKPFFRYYTRQVIDQDVEIMRNQGEALAHFGATRFHSTAADVVHLGIERLRALAREGDARSREARPPSEAEIWI